MILGYPPCVSLDIILKVLSPICNLCRQYRCMHDYATSHNTEEQNRPAASLTFLKDLQSTVATRL